MRAKQSTPRGSKSADAATLRGELGKLISGFNADDEDHVDPFSAPNEWEEEQRAKRSSQAGTGASESLPKVSSSRRAQQAAAKAARASSKGPESDAVARNAAGAGLLEEEDEEVGKSYGKCKLPACADWWQELVAAPEDAPLVEVQDESKLRERAERLYESEVKAHTALQAKKHGADHRMMKKLLSAGTVKDKIAALTVQVHESSFHSLPFLRQLLSMAERPAKEIKLSAVEVTRAGAL